MQISDTNGSRCEDGKSSLQFISSPRAETHGCLAIETCLQTQFSGKISDLRFKKRTGQLKKKKLHVFFTFKNPTKANCASDSEALGREHLLSQGSCDVRRCSGLTRTFPSHGDALASHKPRLGSPGWSRQAALVLNLHFGDSGTTSGGRSAGGPGPSMFRSPLRTRVWGLWMPRWLWLRGRRQERQPSWPPVGHRSSPSWAPAGFSFSASRSEYCSLPP